MKLEIVTPRVFLPLTQKARYKGAFGGRGSGKSHFAAEYVIERSICEPGLRTLCGREVQKSLKESAKRLLEDKIAKLGVGHLFRVLESEIRTPGGGLIVFQGMQDHTAESIKSLENFGLCWIEEAQTLSGRSLELLRPTIRAPGSEFLFSWNPRNASDPVDKLLRGETPPDGSIIVKANYDDNPFFPDELEDERIHDQRNNPERYGHIWLGDYEPAVTGAIWSREVLHRNRRQTAPDMRRILVGVDPAVSSEKGSDEHGIIVAGLGDDKRGYVLDDMTTSGSPRHWAERAIAAHDRYDADAIVVEVNQGGDMVKHTLQSVRPGVRVIEVRATRGKHVRAEPISSLYHLDRISHVGTFDRLENQMCQMTPAGYEGDGSPDRVDALVWAFTELFAAMTVRKSKTVARDIEIPGPGSWMG